MSPTRSLLLLVPLVLAAGCGGPSTGAVVQSGPLEVREKGGAWTSVAEGPAPFGNGGALRVPADASVSVRIGCGVDPVGAAASGDAPAPGTADLVMTRGAVLSRRSGTYFDLEQGTIELHAGPIRSRIVMFHGKSFVEVQESNTQGVRATISTDGDRVDVAVSEGEILLHTPGATPQSLHFVTLGPGESGSAEPGRKPDKVKAQDR